MLGTVSHFHLSLIFEDKATLVFFLKIHHSLIFEGKQEPAGEKPIMVLHSNIKLLSLPSNIRLGWKRLTEIITLAYYVTD